MEIEELLHALLQRFGVTTYEPVEDQEMTDEDWAARMGGCEGYCPTFNAYSYVVFPEDVQNILQEIAAFLHESTEIEFEYYGDEEE